MKKRKKIAFISSKPLDDQRNWSGSMYRMYRCMQEEGFEVFWVPLPEFSPNEKRMFRGIIGFYEKVFRRRFSGHHFFIKSFLSSRKMKKYLKTLDYDILFSPTYINEIAFLNIPQPIVYLNDATFHQLINYNPGFLGMGYLSKKITCAVEKKALHKADVVIFSNTWSGDDARNFYKVPPEKINIIRFGANLTMPTKIINKSKIPPLKVLFLASRRWELKGGPLAYEAFKILRERGWDVEFTIVGSEPDLKDSRVRIFPYINKNTTEGLAHLTQILSESHILLLPTRNDCSPIVMCEAAGFGIVTISTNTGGVPEIVVEGETGFTLPLEAVGEDYATLIEKILQQPHELERLSANARKRYEDVLNWEKWGEEFKRIIEEL